MRQKDRYQYILEHFQQKMPQVTTELEYGSVFQLLVAVVLSAQCTDKRVNMITPQLFAQYPDAKAMAQAEEAEIYELIKSVSYPNAKAKHLVKLARMLMDDFNGEVPQQMEQLTSLPGVGRKSANLVMGDVFGKPAIVTDTHCIRLCNRIGLVDGIKDPAKVEKALWKIIPPEEGNDFCHRLVLHGRAVCDARRPLCEKCCC